MSKLINPRKKSDPIKDWELKDLAKRKNFNNHSGVFFSNEVEIVEPVVELENILKPTIEDSPIVKARKAEILAIKNELYLIQTTRTTEVEVEEQSTLRRRAELINIKKILKTETTRRELTF